MTKPTLRDLVARVETRDLRSLGLQFDEFELRVDTNSAQLLERLTDYFREHVVPVSFRARELLAIQAPEPDFGLDFTDWQRDGGKVGRKDAFADVLGGRVVWKVRTGMQFLFGPETLMAVGDCLANDNQVVNFIIAQYLNHLLRADSVLCHAAGISQGTNGLAIAARAGAGKSTLALKLMSAGVNFVSNDRLVVGPGKGTEIAMYGVPKQPRVNPGTLLNNTDVAHVLPSARARELAGMDRQKLWELEEKYDVDIERVYGEGRWTLARPIRALLVLNWSHDGTHEPRFQPVDLSQRDDLLALVMKGPGPFFINAYGAFLEGGSRLSSEHYIRVLRRVPVFEVVGRVNFSLAAAKCLKLLAEGEANSDKE